MQVLIMDEKLQNKLNKLKELAERGVGGEKETAQKKFDMLLKKHGLTEDDLSDDQLQYYLFSYSNQFTKKLLGQIIFMVMGAAEPVSLYKSKHTRNKLGVYCTPAQKVEIELNYEFYSSLLYEEFDSLLAAFIQKQELFPDDAPVNSVDPAKLSPEELAKLQKEQAFEKSMNKKSLTKMIECK